MPRPVQRRSSAEITGAGTLDGASVIRESDVDEVVAHSILIPEIIAYSVGEEGRTDGTGSGIGG